MSDDSHIELRFPEAFVERMRNLVPPHRSDSFWGRLAGERRPALRMNPLRQAVALTRQRLTDAAIALEPIPWSEWAFGVKTDDRERLSRLEEHASGAIFIQSLSSQLASCILGPQPGEEVLDLAAAPGGKSTHLAALMENTGRLACVEAIRSRFFRLQANLQRQGVTIAQCYLADGRKVGSKVGQRFDRVLLDAPCSGEARFSATDPKSYATWSARKIRETSRKQIGLIKSAFQATKPGGVLVYATCSFAPEENEGVVAKLLEWFPDQVELAPVEVQGRGLEAWGVPVEPGLTDYGGRQWPEALRNTVRIWPDDHYEGFYLAKIIKRDA